jgi:hypothetical protein
VRIFSRLAAQIGDDPIETGQHNAAVPAGQYWGRGRSVSKLSGNVQWYHSAMPALENSQLMLRKPRQHCKTEGRPAGSGIRQKWQPSAIDIMASRSRIRIQKEKFRSASFFICSDA